MIYDFDFRANLKKKSLYEAIAKEILNVWDEKSFKGLKRRYLELSKKCHPDVNNHPSALKKFQDVSLAYKVLTQWDDSLLNEKFVTVSEWDIKIITIKVKMKEKSYFQKWQERYY